MLHNSADLPFSSALKEFKKICQICFHTPCVCQRQNLRQQVAGDGNRSGRSRHLDPLISTQSTPSKQARLSTRGRPTRVGGSKRGNSGMICCHCVSLINDCWMKFI